MIHAFEKEIASEYGMLEAVLLNHIAFWVEKNEANETNFIEGKYWTYNSAKGFEKLFPYATTKQIRSALDHLKAEGLIETGCFNKEPWDRTLWYTLTEKGKCIFPVGQMDVPCGANGDAPEGTPIPDINADINTDKKRVGAMPRPTLEEVKAYCLERKNNVDPERFINHYTANGWRVGKNPMRDWKAAVRTWEREDKEKSTQVHYGNERTYDDDFFANLEGRSK